ncbi:hypothetical protein [Rhizobium herbae]
MAGSTFNLRELDPPTECRFKVEAGMLDLIEQLRGQGLSQPEIAVALADAAEEYVIRLATTFELNHQHSGYHRN